MPLTPGVYAPFFSAPTKARPDFAFGSLAGAYVLMLFLSGDAEADAQAERLVQAQRRRFDDQNLMIFTVIRDAEAFARAEEIRPGLRQFHDVEGKIARLFQLEDGQGGTVGHWILLDPMMRVLHRVRLQNGEAMFRVIDRLPPAEAHSGTAMHAPVLIVPRVFEPDLCRRLMDLYDADGGGVSGVMREVNGRTVPVVDNFKRRRDAIVADEELKAVIRSRLSTRLIPVIKRAFMFEATHIERYIVACYSAEEGGYFRAHRDNTTQGTAHRQFACSINLNAEEFEGGDLRFPEFGRQTYRPPTGGAVIFSCALLHEATPVTRGRRYAYLPFFYDAKHAEIRRRNQHLIGQEPEVRQSVSASA